MPNTTNIQKKIARMITYNWQPKLICLALATLVWVVVDCFYVQDSNEEWDLNNIRISVPD